MAGIEFTPAKIAILATALSTALGSMYGAFEAYKGYMDMKDKIARYVAPDLSEYDKRLAVIEENMLKTEESMGKTLRAVQEGSDKTAEYTRDISCIFYWLS